MKKTIKNIVLALVAITTFSSCSDYLDVNQDPNNPASSTPELTLPVAQRNSASIIMGERTSLNTLGNVFMYNWSQAGGVWYDQEMAFNVTSNFHTSIWDFTYASILPNYQYVSEFNDLEWANYKSIAEIMKAYHFLTLVDVYGDIPYTEALQRAANTAPHYDDDAAIYADLMTKLDDAIAAIHSNAGNLAVKDPADHDIIFQGNMTKWIQFANTLKLQMVVRQSNVIATADAQAALAAIATEGSGYITSDVTVNPGYLNVVGKMNPFWKEYGESTAGNATLSYGITKATDFTLDYLMNTAADNRYTKLYIEAEVDGAFHGISQDNNNGLKEDYSSVGDGIRKSFDQDALLMRGSEALFLQAEAIQRTYMTGNAQTTYETAVSASFAELGAGSAGAVLAGSGSWTAATDKIELIMTQKWIALNGTLAHQSWIDYNRTGFPNFLPRAASSLAFPDRPKNLLYPTSEVANNPNTPGQTQADAFTATIFWQ